MGYTHYYYVKKQFNKTDFAKVVKDFKKILPEILKTPIQDEYATKSHVQFNKDGSIKETIGCIELANGHGEKGTNPIINDNEIIFNGVGELAHETFSLECKKELGEFEQKDKSGKYFEFTKTARKPYDLAVCTALIIAKQYLKNNIKISSDGSIDDEWVYPKQFVQDHLGYGNDFDFEEEEEEIEN